MPAFAGMTGLSYGEMGARSLHWPETASMQTRDGVRLDADIYRPSESEVGPGPHPVLLMRQPYGRRIASTVCYAHPSWYAAQGYIVVIQDVRGRGSSDGSFALFENDIADGADAVAWAAGLPGSNGAVGMYGFSYQGTDQLLAATSAPPALRALAPAMIGWDLRTDWAYENEAFCLQAGLGWAIQVGAETARLAGDQDGFAAFHAASRALPLHGIKSAWPELMERFGHHTHYRDWLRKPADDPYWRRISPSAHAAGVRLPMLFVGGWYDSHLPGTLAAFKHFAAAGAAPTRLVIGPWAHIPWGRQLGGLDFGAAAVTDIDRLQVRWFDHWLKGSDTGLLAEPSVRLFDMGRNAWRDFGAWPAGQTALYLAGSGRASVDEADGALRADPPAHAGIEHLVHDPWRPAPAVGGAYGTPPGPADRAAVDARSDVLTFTTPPLTEELQIAGDAFVELWIESDAPSFDVSAVLSRVTQAGRVHPLAQGYRRVTAPAAPLAIPMRATCASLAPGERLRLSIAAACFPAYPVNPGTGQDPTEASLMDARIITLGVRHGGRCTSLLRITTMP
jgi:putative CocE/NonD family hydrolase